MILALLLTARGEVVPTSVERALLDGGEVVVRQDAARGGSSGLAMILVDAPAEDVWQVVLDYDAYVEFLPYVTASRLDTVEDDVTTYTIELTVKGLSTRYAGTAKRLGDELAWELMPVGMSPMRTSRGSWRVQELEGKTLIVYRAEAETAWWLPTSVHRKAADAGLPTMVRLVAERAVGSSGGG